MTVSVKKAKVVVEDDSCNSDHSESDAELSSNSDNSEIIDEESKSLLNEGWADSIAKILKTNKPKKKKTLVLSKAKKLTDPVKKVQTESYEIATSDGQVKKEQTIIIEAADKEGEGQARKKKRDQPNLRIKPNVLEKDRERTLQKIATKGVVQLFNAVKAQQKDITQKLDEAGPLDVHKEKVLKNIDKRAFLDVLMGEKSKTVDEELSRNKSREVEKRKCKDGSSWDVLRDDFLMSAKMKDWDKELENEEEINQEMEIDEVDSD